MKTQRNKIEVMIRPSDHDMAAQIDTVYEICDAEFPSERHINASAMRVIEKNNSSDKVVKGLAELFVGHVEAVAKREQLMMGLPRQNFEAVARRIAEDWDSTYGADHRMAQRNAPGL